MRNRVSVNQGGAASTLCNNEVCYECLGDASPEHCNSINQASIFSRMLNACIFALGRERLLGCFWTLIVFHWGPRRKLQF